MEDVDILITYAGGGSSIYIYTVVKEGLLGNISMDFIERDHNGKDRRH